MRDFVYLVTDSRYPVPTLEIAPAVNEQQARRVARRLLAESEHHMSVEVRSLDGPLFVVDRAAAGDSLPDGARP